MNLLLNLLICGSLGLISAVSADSPTLTINSHVYSLVDGDFPSLSFRAGVTSVDIQGTFVDEGFQVTVPPPNLFVLSRDYLYVPMQTTDFDHGLRLDPIWDEAMTSDYWINAFSDSEDFTILGVDTSHKERIITLQVQSLQAGQYFWKSIVCAANAVFSFTTWYRDSKTDCKANHEAFVTSYQLSSEVAKETLTKGGVTYGGTVNGDAFHVDLPSLDVVAVARRYVYFISVQQGYVLNLLVQPTFKNASTPDYWITTYSNPNPYEIVSSDTSDPNVVITLEVDDLNQEIPFWQTIATAGNSCYLLTTFGYDGKDHTAEHIGFVSTFQKK